MNPSTFPAEEAGGSIAWFNRLLLEHITLNQSVILSARLGPHGFGDATVKRDIL